MTETKTPETKTPETGALLDILLGMLAPMLMTTDSNHARLAAQQAVQEYNARSQGELVTIAQIVAFALTALDTLRLSMATDLSVSMKLKLRGNANALSRVSLQATKTLDQSRRAGEPTLHDWIDAPDPAPAEPPVPETPAPTPPAAESITQHPVPATLPVQQQNRCHWANAMATVAAELQARAAEVPPAQRKSDQLWVKVLANVAGELRQPDNAPAGLSKTDLFRTTLIAGSGGFPGHLLAKTPPRRAGK